MQRKTLVIASAEGLRARPATLLVQAAAKYESQIFIEKDGQKINAKSLMGVLSLGLRKGESINLIIMGDDEEKAMNAITGLIEKNFVV
ncbi:MAG: HPr family phosphocarrier protein [Bacillota bacterium]|nr:HPr family phosphocarrier protein [Bacillota bacterium]